MINETQHGCGMRRLLAALAVGIAGILSMPAQGAGVAMVTDLQGKASATAQGRARDLSILSELEPGSQVDLAAGASMVALYLDAGDEYVFKGPAQILFNASQPQVIKGARAEKRSPALGKGGKDIRIKPGSLAQGAMVMRGGILAARIKLQNLHATRTLETQPEFRWQELQPGLQYQFELNDDTGRTLQEAQVSATSFKLPESIQLKEGATYSWGVSVRLPDGRKYSSSGTFIVAGADLRAQAESLRPASSAPLSARVAYAAWLDQAELKDEARKYWRAAASERPEDPRLKALAEQ